MLYQVKVKFGCEFIEVNGNEIIIGLSSKPIKGRANRELIRKLAKYFGVSTSNVHILSGFKSKNKIVEILPR